MTAEVEAVDLPAWIEWSLAGLRLFSGPSLPEMRTVVLEARRVVLAVAIDTHDANISRLAKSLGLSRRVAREYLRAAGLYPLTPRE